jgi:prepilin-type N-terminal cleavage/methylation domain-containing protein
MNKMNFKNSKGFTIIELVITMVLIGIVAYIAADAMSTGFKAFFVTDNRKEALDQARIAMERMTREIRNIRGSSDISTANATTLTFTDISGTTITFTLNAGNINRTSGTTNTLATGISNSTLASGIFSYTLTDGTTVTQTPTAAERLLIKRIKIDFKATYNNENVALQSEVWPRNL